MESEKMDVNAHQGSTDSKVVSLKAFIDNAVGKANSDKKDIEEILLPVKRINSLPAVYEFVPFAKDLYPDSKSLDFDCDGAPHIPNQVVYMEELPDDMSPGTAFGIPGSVSFMYGDIGGDDVYMLKEVESRDSKHFLTTRVGKKNLEKIYAKPQFQAFHREITSYMDDPENPSAPEKSAVNSSKKRKARKVIRSCTFQVTLLVLLSIFLFIGIPAALVFSGVYVPMASEFLHLIAYYRNASSPWSTYVNVWGHDQPAYLAQMATTPHMNMSQIATTPIPVNGPTPNVVVLHFSSRLFTLKGFKHNNTHIYKHGDEELKQAIALMQDTLAYIGFTNTIVEARLVSFYHEIFLGYFVPMRLDFYYLFWLFQGIILMHETDDLGLFKWYGFKKNGYNSQCADHLATLINVTMSNLGYATFTRFRVLFDQNDVFLRTAKERYDETRITRPPRHISDKWGDCTGPPVCPVMPR